MPIELSILSGARQGDCVEFDRDEITIGDAPEDHVYFDASSDQPIAGRRVALRAQPDGWHIHNLCAKHVIVNQQIVNSQSRLRSGDIIRLSEDGPDVTFSLISKMSQSTSVVPQPTVPKPIPSTPAASSESSADTSNQGHTQQEPQRTIEARPQPSSIPVKTIVLSVASLSIVLLLYLVSRSMFGNLPVAGDIRFAPSKSFTIEEGSAFQWEPILQNTGESVPVNLVYSLLGEIPKDISLEPESGLIRWTPSEEQGPKKYQLTIAVANTTYPETYLDKQQIEVEVTEVAQAPLVIQSETVAIDLTVSREMEHTIQAKDLDVPASPLTYSLVNEAPVGAALDAGTGHLTWAIPEGVQPQRLEIPFWVSKKGDKANRTQGSVVIQISQSDSWGATQASLTKQCYLLVATKPPARSLMPLGVATAIQQDTLVTSADVVAALHKTQQMNWKVLAIRFDQIDHPEESGLLVGDLFQLNGLESAEGAARVHLNLGIVKVEQSAGPVASLATPTDTTDPTPLAVLGYPITGDHFDADKIPGPSFGHLNLLDVIPLKHSGSAAGPPVLQLSGNDVGQMFGAPIVNQKGQVTGVYGHQSVVTQGTQTHRLHYGATMLLVEALTAGVGDSAWTKLSASKEPQQSQD